jgi:hypothetical protein
VANNPKESERDYWQMLPDEPDLLRVAANLEQNADWDGLQRLYPALTGYLWSTGNYPEYASFEEKCLKAAAAKGDRPWEAKIRSELGFLKAELRQPEEADALYRQAQAIHDAAPEQVFEQARVRRYRALLELHRDNLDAAVQLLAETEERLAQLTNPPETRLDLAWLWLHTAKMRARYNQRRFDEAEAEGWEADRIRSALNTRGGYRSAGYKILLGNVLLAQDRPTEAICLWEGMLAEEQGQALLVEHADAQMRLAWLYANREQSEHALEMLVSAIQLYIKYGDMPNLALAERLQQCIRDEKPLLAYEEFSVS